MARFDVGDLVRTNARFTDPDNNHVAVDPSVVQCNVRNPSTGVVTTHTFGSSAIIKVATGHYRLSINVTVGGRWWTYWYSSGTYQSAEEKSFQARTPRAV